MRLAIILSLLFALSGEAFAHSVTCSPGDAGVEQTVNEARLVANSLPLCFIENQGQAHSEVRYTISGKDKTVFFTDGGLTFSLADHSQERSCWTVKLDFVGANPHCEPEGRNETTTVISYFKGDSNSWSTAVPSYHGLKYRHLWPGIDLKLNGEKNQLKYEFIVAPGADPSRIRLKYRGLADLVVNGAGALEVNTPVGTMVDGKPIAYQLQDGIRVEVSMAYALDSETRNGEYEYGFNLGDYDPALPLIMDPCLLVYCGFIGGNGDDSANGVAIDSQGCAYITGWTNSDATSFPVGVGPDLTINGDYDAFIAKVNAQGTGLVYCGYIGGDHDDIGADVVVDAQGQAYIVGYSDSTGTSFPTHIGPDLTHNGGDDTFIAKISDDGSSLLYCGYIGGEETDFGCSVAVDDLGQAHVLGITYGGAGRFPTVVGPDLTYNGSGDLFVSKVSAGGDQLIYCGFIGGDRYDEGNDIDIDSQGCVYVTGKTSSDETTFPVLIGPDLTYEGYRDAFIAKVAADGSSLSYCGYIGGDDSWYEVGMGVVADHDGCAYVVGITDSSETSFPVTVGPDLTYNGGSFDYGDGFVAKVTADGTQLLYCGYIGGEYTDQLYDVDVDSIGRIYVTGFTASDESTFPVQGGPDLTHGGGYPDPYNDSVIACVSPGGESLEYCGYISSQGNNYSHSIALDRFDNACVVGRIESFDTGFPKLIGPDLTFNGGKDAFIAKVSWRLAVDTHELSVTGGTVDFLLNAGNQNTGRWYLILGSFHGSSPGFDLPNGGETLPINWDNLTDYIWQSYNSPVLAGFLAPLGTNGVGSAQLNVGSLSPNKIGKVMTFAYCLENLPDWDFVSNPVEVEIIP